MKKTERGGRGRKEREGPGIRKRVRERGERFADRDERVHVQDGERSCGARANKG
ncbi:hypothetical protein GCM10010298_46910 [Streptomyces microflavus]|uniref:Uncharacterized protein n=1 Tax=Streptomyces microflavus TaxID=1919 RepID=A0A7J0CH45_STRMI|nr:hypothetical protein Smic_03660 [Streptomyces microflavus]GGX76503.1 hypothetical protein GCM10010298_46910 [Streptomyces microflavus]